MFALKVLALLCI